MVFTSFEFIIFFLIVYSVYLLVGFNIRHGLRLQNFLLLVSSYVFYGWWDWRFLTLILFSTVVDYYCGLTIASNSSERRKKHCLTLSVVSNLGILGFFKYFNFFSASLSNLFDALGMQAGFTTLNILLPVGISFYTFQTMSYTIDIYRGKCKPVRNFADFALYVAFFPQLVAGPIERAERLLPQLCRARELKSEQLSQGAWLILWGFYKKLFIADNLAVIADRAFDPGLNNSPAIMLLGVYAFSFQIFCDFSGYSNIARGVAKLLGIELILNFKTPYFVRNPQQFWQHWHISLSTWLRDYLYIPLGGSRAGASRTMRNLFTTMLLGGLWHGASWTFVLWGAYHGALLAIHRVVSPVLGSFANKNRGINLVFGAFSVLLMYHLTCIGWILFRASSFSYAVEMLSAIAFDISFLSQPSPMALSQLQELFQKIWLLLIVQYLCWKNDNMLAVLSLPLLLRTAIIVCAFYSILWFGAFGGKEFIYFQF